MKIQYPITVRGARKDMVLASLLRAGSGGQIRDSPCKPGGNEKLEMDVPCTSLDEVRQEIYEIDRNLVSLLAKRGR